MDLFDCNRDGVSCVERETPLLDKTQALGCSIHSSATRASGSVVRVSDYQKVLNSNPS